MLAIDALEDYCRSHFYYYFKECDPRIKPRLADSLNTIAIKIQQAMLLKFTVRKAISLFVFRKKLPQNHDS
jgi:hypothetical protein